MRIHSEILLLLLLPCCFSVSAQTTTFTLNGSIEGVNTGTVKIWQPRSDSSFYVFETPAEIRDGQFQISGHLEFPRSTALAAFDENGALVADTEWFYLDPGPQHIFIASAEHGRRIISSGKSFEEYKYLFRPGMDSLRFQGRKLRLALEITKDPAIRGSLSRLYRRMMTKQGIFLLEYTLEHPDSYISLGAISSFVDLDNYLFSEQAFSLLDPELRQSSQGRKIEKDLLRARALQPGRRFPDFQLLDLAKNQTSLYQTGLGKLTLIDFWFNSCGFCLQQFPELKAIYREYADKGLSIIGITVDKERFEADWRAAIQTNELPWPQYWDFNGDQCADYMIDNFPANFLLDAEGRILKRNLSTEDLRAFLRSHL